MCNAVVHVRFCFAQAAHGSQDDCEQDKKRADFQQPEHQASSHNTDLIGGDAAYSDVPSSDGVSIGEWSDRSTRSILGAPRSAAMTFYD